MLVSLTQQRDVRKAKIASMCMKREVKVRRSLRVQEKERIKERTRKEKARSIRPRRRCNLLPKSNPNPKGTPKADAKGKAKAKATANKLLGVDENKPSVNMTRINHHCDAWRPTVAKVTSCLHSICQVGPPTAAKMTSGVSGEQGGVPEWVLLDSGANEICRPLESDMNFGDRNKYLPLDVTLASGKVTTGFRSAKDGEIFMPMEGHDWIAGLSKLVGAGFKFVWDRHGPKLISEDTGIVIDAVLRNGLPYVKWSDFKRARSKVSRLHKKAPHFMCDSFNAHVQEEPPTILKAGEAHGF